MKTTILAPVFGALIVAGVASTAAATTLMEETFSLSVDGCGAGTPCFGPGVTSLGTVTVTETKSGALDFQVNLSGALINVGSDKSPKSNNQHDALAFSVDGTGVSGVAISKLTSGFVSAVATSPTYSAPPFTSGKNVLDYYDVIDFANPNHLQQGSTPSTFSFEVTDSGHNLTLSDLTASSTSTYGAIYIAADVYANKNTGNVGAPGGMTSIATPEPASWALMLLGVGLTGASLRSRRRSAQAPARV